MKNFLDTNNNFSFDKEVQKDHFVKYKGMIFAGHHYLIDMWDVNIRDNVNYINGLLFRASKAANATVLHQHAHHFGDNMGISAIAILAESHISVHTWPERNYVAFDIFMCGNTDPDLTLNLLKKELKPSRINVKKIKRGLIK